MWKAVLLLVALMVAGHFAVQYLRTNPLDPVFEGGELVVETSEPGPRTRIAARLFSRNARQAQLPNANI